MTFVDAASAEEAKAREAASVPIANKIFGFSSFIISSPKYLIFITNQLYVGIPTKVKRK